MNKDNKPKITFWSGAGSVTGANFLIEFPDRDGYKKILVDCGMLQGSSLADEENWEKFPYDPLEIDYLVVTHSHIDHVGRIPKLVYEGFRGEIYSTIPSKDIAQIMLEDTNVILGKVHDKEIDKIYTEKTLRGVMALWKTADYHQEVKITDRLSFYFKDAGHILGSAMITFVFDGKKIVFTGDLGNSPSPILKDTEALAKDIDYLIMESVYGDRNHEDRAERKKKLEKVIEDTYTRGGILVIPTFSLERSQELLFEINDFVENKRIPSMPIYLDSPLAIRLTSVYSRYSKYFKDSVKDLIASGDDIFMFKGLQKTLETRESKQILKHNGPKIILAGSGMSSGGRVIHHEKNYLPNPKNTLLLIGYQSEGTLGREIENGAKKINILGEEVPVKAKIEKISGYSGHKDSDGLFKFVSEGADNLKKVFVVMGEPGSSLHLVQRLRDNLAIDAVAPDKGETFMLEL